MTDLPTLLFSDIEGSTRLLSRLGDRYGDVLSAQRQIMRAAIAAHSERLGDPWGLACDHSNLAVALLRAGRHLEAKELLRTNAAAAVGLGDVELSINVLEAFCVVFAELGAAQRSARMLGATTSLRAFNESPIPAPDAELLDASISKVRDLPDPQTWAANLQKGAGYLLGDALADALADP